MPGRRGNPDGVFITFDMRCRYLLWARGYGCTRRISPGSRPTRGRRAGGHLLARRVAAAAPGHERAANLEQRRGVLDDDLERGQRPRGNEVERLDAVRPGLGAGMDDAGIGHVTLHDRALQERGLASRALDQRDVRIRQRDRQRQARNAGPGAEVGQRSASAGPARARAQPARRRGDRRRPSPGRGRRSARADRPRAGHEAGAAGVQRRGTGRSAPRAPRCVSPNSGRAPHISRRARSRAM